MTLGIREQDRRVILKCLDADRDPRDAMAARDLFALGCHLHSEGRKVDGSKACRTALRALRMRECVIRRLLTRLPGNEMDLAMLVMLHVEIRLGQARTVNRVPASGQAASPSVEPAATGHGPSSR